MAGHSAATRGNLIMLGRIHKALQRRRAHSIRLLTGYYPAILQLRLPDEVRTVWVDVLCIDQYDIREKSHQVQLIRRIYQSADHVVAWPGEDGSDVKKALEFCDFLTGLLLNKVSKLKEHYKLYQNRWLACEALFFRRPGWRRQWTITEVCHDKPVQVHWTPLIHN